MNGLIFLQCKTHEMYLQGIELFPVSNHCQNLQVSCSYQTTHWSFPSIYSAYGFIEFYPYHGCVVPAEMANFVGTIWAQQQQEWEEGADTKMNLLSLWNCPSLQIALLQHMSFILDLLKAMSAKVRQSHTVFVICLIHMKQQQHSVLSSFSELTWNRKVLSFTHRDLTWLFCMFLWGAVSLDNLIYTIVALIQFQNIIHFFCTSVKIG